MPGIPGWGRVLVVAAHPDDEVLGCGATLARHCASGGEAMVYFCANGETSKHYRPGAKADSDQAGRDMARRLADAGRASKVLGIGGIMHADGPDSGWWMDQRLDIHPVAHVSDGISEAIGLVMPRTVLTHWVGDLNADHRKVAEAVLVALRDLGTARRVMAFEVPETTSRAPVSQFVPDVFVPVRFVDMEKKVGAMAEYRSESRGQGLRSPTGMFVQAQMRALACGLASYAEAFALYREVAE